MGLFEQYGITQTMLQIAVVAIIAAILIGLYWRILAIGAGALFVVFVFAYNPSVAKVQSIAPTEVTVPNTPEVKEEAPTDKQTAEWHRQFMEDCLNVTMNTKDQCETIWSERIEDEKNPKRRKVIAVNPRKLRKVRCMAS